MPLTSSMEDYLEAVLIVAKKQIEVRSVDIARQLNVSKPSVWRAMTVLKDGGFLSHFSSLRNFRLGRLFDSLGRGMPRPCNGQQKPAAAGCGFRARSYG